MKKAIVELIKSIDEDIKVVFHKGALECDIEENTVYIGNELTDEEDELFLDFVKELNPRCNYNAFLMGILHEVFHIITYDEELDKDRDEQYALLKAAYYFNILDKKSLNKEYFKIPLELNATEAAIDFAIANQSRMDKFNQVITKRRNG